MLYIPHTPGAATAAAPKIALEVEEVPDCATAKPKSPSPEIVPAAKKPPPLPPDCAILAAAPLPPPPPKELIVFVVPKPLKFANDTEDVPPTLPLAADQRFYASRKNGTSRSRRS